LSYENKEEKEEKEEKKQRKQKKKKKEKEEDGELRQTQTCGIPSCPPYISLENCAPPTGCVKKKGESDGEGGQEQQ